MGVESISQLRFDLAAAYRLHAKYGLNEGVCNHLTVTTDEAHSKFLVIPHGVSWAQVQPDDLVLVDSEGNLLEGEGEVDKSALTIHAAVHQACGDKGKAVFHTHMPWATTMCAMQGAHGGKLLQVHQNACRFFDAAVYDERYGGVSEDMDEACLIARRFAEAAKDKSTRFPRAVFLANHGIVIVGHSVAEAWDDMYYLERACQVQVQALMAVGGDVGKLKLIDDATAEKTYVQTMKNFNLYAEKHMAACIGELCASDAAFAAHPCAPVAPRDSKRQRVKGP